MTPFVQDADFTLYVGDALSVLHGLPDESVHMCCTSPPYWGLRDYGTAGQLGLESSPDEFVAAIVEVFREVRRVLRADGTLWLNLGDSYAGGGPSNHGRGASTLNDDGRSDEALQRVRTRISDTAGAAGRWFLATQPYPEAHFATFPEALPERCIKAGCPEGGTVLDPFGGSGTTALVARKLRRRSLLIELSPEYAALCARRLQQQSLFAGDAA